jgi:hypothetical protein
MMRTTLTIDHDVAIALDRLRERDALSLKSAVNEALRRGLHVMETEADALSVGTYTLPAWDSGGMRVGIDNVAEALDWAEGEGRK